MAGVVANNPEYLADVSIVRANQIVVPDEPANAIEKIHDGQDRLEGLEGWREG